VLHEHISITYTAGEDSGLKINISETKTMAFDSQTIEEQMKVGNKKIEDVTEFEFLLTWNNDCGQEMAEGLGFMAGFENIWTSEEFRVKTRFNILRTSIFIVLLYKHAKRGHEASNIKTSCYMH
jgi:hypothetical protein